MKEGEKKGGEVEEHFVNEKKTVFRNLPKRIPTLVYSCMNLVRRGPPPPLPHCELQAPGGF